MKKSLAVLTILLSGCGGQIPETPKANLATQMEEPKGMFPPQVVTDVPNPVLGKVGPEDVPLIAQAQVPSTQTLSNKDRWTGAAIAAKEAGVNQPQGQADVMQSIHNRIKAPAYGCNGIADCVNKKGQYEPTFSNPQGWRNINSPESASRVSGVPVGDILQVDRNLNNPNLQKNAKEHVGCRTDFQGMSQKKYKQPGDVDRGNGHNFFGNFYPNSGYNCK